MTPSPQGRRAVVIEDPDDIRTLLAETIRMRGFTVTSAATAQEGLDAVRRGGADRLSGTALGADDYISKPFSPRELQARIEAMFRRPRGRAEQADAEELHRAAEVQRSLLPLGAPAVSGYGLAGACRSSLRVGGDFFDWHAAGDGVQLTVADAMGKGMGAAIFAATVRAVMRSTAPFPDLGRAFADAGRHLEEDLQQSGSFVTVFSARLDAAGGTVDYVDAGHGLGLHVHAGGVGRLPPGGPPVGAVPGSEWVPGRVSLAPGDTLVVVGDGVLDAFDHV